MTPCPRTGDGVTDAGVTYEAGIVAGLKVSPWSLPEVSQPGTPIFYRASSCTDVAFRLASDPIQEGLAWTRTDHCFFAEDLICNGKCFAEKSISDTSLWDYIVRA